MQKIFGTNPKKPGEEKRSFPDVKVYWVGTQQQEAAKRPDGTYGKLPISADGFGTVNAPDIGEYLVVPANKAEALIRNSRIEFPRGHELEGQTYEGFTTDARLAEYVKRSWNSGKPLKEVKAEAALEDLSVEALEEMLKKKRGLESKAQIPEAQGTGDAEGLKEELNEAEPKKAGRPKKENADS